MNHRTNHSPKDKRTARRNLSYAVPSPRVNKEKAASTSGSHRPSQRGTAMVPAPVEKDTSVQAVEEAAWKKHKLPKTLEEAMQMNRASVLLLSVPESDTECRMDNDKPSITMEDQAEQDSLLDCSITSIHIAEGRHRPKQRVLLPEQGIDLAFDTEKELDLNAIRDGSATSDEASDDHIASPQYGSISFHLPAQADRGEVSVVFEKPFVDTQYVITANASIPGVMVSVTQRQRYSAVLTVERIHSGPLCEGLVLWIAMGQ
ncbi:WIAG-tail domain [Paenibacillus polymyxa]|uniref:WIAG-tail domain n=1 Tax=Paenibacillus polymyxa TaxID=1406 RepID=UPI002024F716|nr:WIAG-tail domain [Paenibacillus polymyxa]WDZ55013.1 WIAG-tail domain [Paenibacillus polymyxa]